MRTQSPAKQVSARTVRVGAGRGGMPATLHEPMTSQFVAGQPSMSRPWR